MKRMVKGVQWVKRIMDGEGKEGDELERKMDDEGEGDW